MARTNKYAGFRMGLNKKSVPEQEIILSKDAPFLVAEAYKTIRTNLMFVLPKTEKKRLVVSSSQPGEGKSVTAINIGIAFSQLGYKVLLIDGDMRKPTIYKKLKLNKSKGGLSSILVGLCKFSDAVKKVAPNFDVLTSGPIPPNPSELLSSDIMSELLEFLEGYYDYILIDTPPVNFVTDALVLTPKTDGLAFVVREGATTHEALKKALNAIEFADIKLLGVILNGDKENRKYGYKYLGKYKDYEYGNH